MGSPYRELPKLMLCPRCGEELSRVLEGVSACARCEGLWIAPGTLDAAFGNPRWPPGQTLWWRNSIECPECTFEGKQTVMTARMSNDVLVDQCPDHGVWLDRGELGRLMNTTADDLTALRARLAVMAPDLEQVVARREQWRADLELRRRATLDYRKTLEAEHGRRPAPAAAVARAPQPERAAGRRQQLGTARAQASAEVSRLAGELAALRGHIERLDVDLADARRRAAGLEHELDTTRARLIKLDAELDPQR